jgi:aminoglycoside/choline kinase family phosphotransferase
VRDWALSHRLALERAGHLGGCGPEQFLRWFDLMGLQRHLKVLGTFARLHLRDGKSGYLADLPLVLRYVRETLQRRSGEEPALGALQRWFDRELAPRIAASSWGRPA